MGTVSAEVVKGQSDTLSGRHTDPPRTDGVERGRVERDVVDYESGVCCKRDGRSSRTLGLVVGHD